jgi:hypothetical protein
MWFLTMFSNLPMIILHVTKTNLMLKMHFKDNHSFKSTIVTISMKSWPFAAVASISVVCCRNLVNYPTQNRIVKRSIRLCMVSYRTEYPRIGSVTNPATFNIFSQRWDCNFWTSSICRKKMTIVRISAWRGSNILNYKSSKCKFEIVIKYNFEKWFNL